MAQDAIGTLITNGTQSGITVTYDDANNKLDFTVTASGGGDVTGPSSATDGNIVLFDGITGKVIKNSAYSPSSFEPANTNIQTHISSTGNPHSVTKSQVGLGNVLNLEQKVHHGFVDRTNTSLSFNNGTRTFTLNRLNAYTVYVGGVAHQPSGNLTVIIGTEIGRAHV